MTSGINSYRFKLESDKAKRLSNKKRKFLIARLKELGVRVNNPFEMNIEHLEALVNRHRKTVEARKDYISRNHLDTARRNGLTKQDVLERVRDLNWDAGNAANVKKSTESKPEQREKRRLERLKMIQQMNELEKAEGLE